MRGVKRTLRRCHGDDPTAGPPAPLARWVFWPAAKNNMQMLQIIGGWGGTEIIRADTGDQLAIAFGFEAVRLL
jgi:hypothetical protein